MFCFGNTTCRGNQDKFKKYSCEKSDRKDTKDEDDNTSKEDDSNRSDTEDGDGTNKKYEIPQGCTTHFPRDSGCQNLDVTGIKPGDYFLRFIVNPAMLTAEEKFDNNVVTCKIKLDWLCFFQACRNFLPTTISGSVSSSGPWSPTACSCTTRARAGTSSPSSSSTATCTTSSASEVTPRSPASRMSHQW